MEKIVLLLNKYVTYISQILAIIVIVIGIFKALWTFLVHSLFKRNTKAQLREGITESRMELGHSFSLGLGFLIGASILKSVIAPTWDDIGKLSSIITIRTVLNYFLTKEIASFQSGKNNGTTDDAKKSTKKSIKQKLNILSKFNSNPES